jgi:hypothetical protein
MRFESDFFNTLTSDATQWRTEIGWPIFQTAKERSKRKKFQQY